MLPSRARHLLFLNRSSILVLHLMLPALPGLIPRCREAFPAPWIDELARRWPALEPTWSPASVAGFPMSLPILLPCSQPARSAQLKQPSTLHLAALVAGGVNNSFTQFSSPEEGDSAQTHGRGGVQTGVRRCAMRILLHQNRRVKSIAAELHRRYRRESDHRRD